MLLSKNVLVIILTPYKPRLLVKLSLL